MKNLFRSFLLSAIMLTAGVAVSCTEDGKNESYQGIPTIQVDPISVTVGLEGGTTENVAVVTPAEWVLDIDTEGVIASATSGFGDAVLTFEVPAAEAMRTIKVTFIATGYVSGYPITKKATLTISQSDSDIPTVGGEFVYYDNCGDTIGTKASFGGQWPFVDAYTGWNPKGGEGFDQSGVTYTGMNASVRNSGKTWAPVGATYATDAPYAYLQAKSDTYFMINNINIKSGVKAYTFAFTAFNQYANLSAEPHTPAPVSPLKSGENLTVEVSVDGTNWGVITFTTMPDGNWEYVIAPFTLPADADKLFVRFSDYKADTTTPLPSTEYQYQGNLRFDDFRLVEGGNGPVVEFNNAGGGSGEIVEGTIDTILAGGEGNYSLKNAWVVATYGRGCLVTDASGKYILCYMGENKTIPAVGTVVNVEGAVTTYAGLLQFAETAVVTATTETKSVTLGTPTALTGADLDKYVTTPEIKYASFEGALVISGNFYNVTVEGASTAVGSLSYPAGDIATQLSALNGKGIKVTGFMIGVSSSKYTNMMVTAVSATGNDPEVPESTTATKIDKIASLVAGNYIMAGYATEYKDNNNNVTDFSANPYHCWTGSIASSYENTDLETGSYSHTDGVLAPGTGVLTAPAVVTLEAVEGKANTYYVKVGTQYLGNSANGTNRRLTLVADKIEWVASDFSAGGIILSADGVNIGTGKAKSNLIRSYKDATYTTSLQYGLVFFTTDGSFVPTPDPEPTPGDSAYTSASIFTVADGNTSLGTESKINGSAATGFKLGASQKTGVFTSGAVGVTGDKTLEFYGFAWKGKSATIYIKVEGGGSVSGTSSIALTANEGATGNAPFTITATDSDLYTVTLTGLTAESKIVFSTAETFDEASSSNGRAILAGVNLK